jgi:benzil reductase ((S)-benzoin forming)
MKSEPLAVVTGTSSGLGEAVAALLLGTGWDVIGVARRPAPILHPRYRHLALDLADLESMPSVMEREVGDRLRQGASRIGLVNNAAAAGLLGPTEEAEPVTTLRSYAVNTVAPVWLMGLVVRLAPRATPVRIVNVSSGAAIHPFPGLGTYSGCKAGLRMSGLVFAAELDSPLHPGGARPDVSILNYAPGVVDTPMQTMARATPADRFPWVGTFKDFAAKGMMVSPAKSAEPILRYLESDPAERFREERFAG